MLYAPDRLARTSAARAAKAIRVTWTDQEKLRRARLAQRRQYQLLCVLMSSRSQSAK
jgi:hypothetical protein